MRRAAHLNEGTRKPRRRQGRRRTDLEKEIAKQPVDWGQFWSKCEDRTATDAEARYDAM